MSQIRGTVVIDPGHGGTTDVGGSDANHAKSPSGVLEKNLTLELAVLVEQALQASAPGVRVIKTRSADVNLSLADRAKVARDNQADLFLSIHFNGFDGKARGVEVFIRPAASNVNLAEDRAFAARLQANVVKAIRARDPGTKDRGVKEGKLGVIADSSLGNTPAVHKTRACLLEVEFMDVPAVDRLLNTGPDAPAVRREIARAIADAMIADLESRPKTATA
jgi:N-acetylmuramoyl-L-alanine amidase